MADRLSVYTSKLKMMRCRQGVDILKPILHIPCLHCLHRLHLFLNFFYIYLVRSRLTHCGFTAYLEFSKVFAEIFKILKSFEKNAKGVDSVDTPGMTGFQPVYTSFFRFRGVDTLNPLV